MNEQRWIGQIEGMLMAAEIVFDEEFFKRVLSEFRGYIKENPRIIFNGIPDAIMPGHESSTSDPITDDDDIDDSTISTDAPMATHKPTGKKLKFILDAGKKAKWWTDNSRMPGEVLS